MGYFSFGKEPKANFPIKEQDPELHAASISAGLYMCNIGDSFDECYTKADKALYFVKQNGKSDFSFHEK